jgi:hypothetical protein
MVAAQWGESRDPDARTGGGVSGRFRLLGASGEAPDTTPPPFGTAPWGYRRSEVDAWASWVAGLVAHGRNETVRADSAEATLRATLERLEQLERSARRDGSAPAADTAGPLPTRQARDGSGDGGPGDAEPPAPGTAPPDRGPATGSGRFRFDLPADLPRRTGRGTPAPAGPAAERDPEHDPDPAPPEDPAPAPDASRDHDLARLRVVESTLHEVLDLLHHLAGRTAT